MTDTTRPPSRPYVPVGPEEMDRYHTDAALAACYSSGLTEAQTIAVLAEQLASLRREYLRYLETDARPMVLTLSPKQETSIAVAAERAACASDLDALAAHEDRNADAATDDATRTVASLVATAYRCAASTIRDRK